MDVCSLIRKNLYCCYRLELLVSDLLSLYAEKLDDSEPQMRKAKIILKAVAIESTKHAAFIELLTRFFRIHEESIECREVVGEPWIVIQKLLNDIVNGMHIDLKEFVDKQRWIEETVGEESYHKLLIPLLSEAIKEGCVDEYSASAIESILNKIVVDEEWHEKAINTIISKTI